MYELYVSDDCGQTYIKTIEAVSIDELEGEIKKADDEMLRWYLMKDGKDVDDVMCAAHRSILECLEKIANKGT